MKFNLSLKQDIQRDLEIKDNTVVQIIFKICFCLQMFFRLNLSPLLALAPPMLLRPLPQNRAPKLPIFPAQSICNHLLIANNFQDIKHSFKNRKIKDFRRSLQGLHKYDFWPFQSILCLLPQYNVSVTHSVVSDSLRPHGLQPTRFLCPWDSPGKNTGVHCHSLLQIFPIQGWNLCLLRLH